MELKIKKELEDLFPPLTDTEFSELEKDILKNGVLDSIKTWNGFIIDGHNRYRICQKHNIKKFPVREMTFDCESDAMAWMVSNQTGRRHFSPMENIGILEKIREKRKEEARIRQLSTLRNSKVLVGANLPQREKPQADEDRVNEQMAKLANMSRKTYEAARVIYNEGTEEQKERANKGGKGNGMQRIAGEIKGEIPTEGTQTCISCGRTLPISNFRWDYKAKRMRPKCIECLNKDDREWYARTKESPKKDDGVLTFATVEERNPDDATFDDNDFILQLTDCTQKCIEDIERVFEIRKDVWKQSTRAKAKAALELDRVVEKLKSIKGDLT